jgi:hypothetical protein
VIITRNITRSLVNGVVTLTAADIDNGSWDNCGIDSASLTLSQTVFTCADIGENTVTLTALDQHGNENSATAIVTVTGAVPQPSITISRTNHTYTGLPANTIALGYGAQQLKLAVSSVPGTTYEWSPAAGLSHVTGASTVFTPSAEGTYTFTVQATNQYGCAGTAEVTVHVIDARCGFWNNKVQVCLHVGRHDVELCVSTLAVKTLLKTGATLGSCGASQALAAQPEEQGTPLTAYPNPFEHNIELQFSLPAYDRHVELAIYDIYGDRVVKVFEGSVAAGQSRQFTVDANRLRNGVYIARLVTSAGEIYNVKLIRKE